MAESLPVVGPESSAGAVAMTSLVIATCATAAYSRAMNRIEQRYNDPRVVPANRAGHYESWFVRANHPTRPLGLWVRYTVFQPRGDAGAAIGELWAIAFNGETGRHAAAKSEFPMGQCEFQSDPLQVTIGTSTLGETRLQGEAGDCPGSRRLRWDLQISEGSQPLFLFPTPLYDTRLPRAKVLTGCPNALVSGYLVVDGEEWCIERWPGSHNHNWGSRHTDRYAWGQVAGFEEEPDAFLELATAQLRFGPLWTPALTPLVLRLRGQEYRLNDLLHSFRRARYSYYDWSFQAQSPQLRIRGRFHAAREDFICLRYRNPPGGWKHCLNSKIADAEMTVEIAGESQPLQLRAARRAAFEILTDDTSHGLTPMF